jgi:hypothetical protein
MGAARSRLHRRRLSDDRRDLRLTGPGAEFRNDASRLWLSVMRSWDELPIGGPDFPP